MIIKFIRGEESLDNFDAYLNTLNSMGIERLREIIQNAVDDRIPDRKERGCLKDPAGNMEIERSLRRPFFFCAGGSAAERVRGYCE